MYDDYTAKEVTQRRGGEAHVTRACEQTCSASSVTQNTERMARRLGDHEVTTWGRRTMSLSRRAPRSELARERRATGRNTGSRSSPGMSTGMVNGTGGRKEGGEVSGSRTLG